MFVVYRVTFNVVNISENHVEYLKCIKTNFKHKVGMLHMYCHIHLI